MKKNLTRWSTVLLLVATLPAFAPKASATSVNTIGRMEQNAYVEHQAIVQFSENQAETIEYTTDDGFVYSLDTETQEASFWRYRGDATEVVVSEFVIYKGKEYKVTSLGDSCFYKCSSLTSIEIPSSVTSLGDYCFFDCSSLTSIEIPSSVTSLGDYCFSGSSLTSIEIPSSVTSLGDGCFAWCRSLTSIEIPSSVTSLNGCFCGCESLTSIEIPESVTSLGGSCFYRCESLTSIRIPEYVTSLGGSCFADCSSLTSIISESENPLKINTDYDCAFKNIPSTCTLTVHYGKREAYIAAGWTEEIFGGGIVETSYNLASDNYLTLSDAETCKGSGMVLSVDMHNSRAISTFQFELSLPTGMTLSDCLLTDRKDANHTVSYSRLANGNYKVTVFSRNGQYFLASEGSLLELSLDVDGDVPSGDYPVLVKNIWMILMGPSTSQMITPDDVRATLTVMGTSAINSYTLTYTLDGETYKTSILEYGAAITPEDEPTKEGYTFSGWSEVPKTMPANDVTVTGTFTINSYTLTYVVDGETYKTGTLEYGAAITPEDEPTKEGYTFSGWSEIPKTMPANDVTIAGTFSINSYTLTYMLDGETYKTCALEYGAAITPEDEPTKEGYTFSGWSEIPKTMPANDVTVTGTFATNSYTLVYTLNGETYKTNTLEYGATITPENEPTKEGYTFSGWSEIPKTMPANDVTIAGTFSINSYTLTYTLDGETYKTSILEYGAIITPEDEPTKEGYTFCGWSEIPEKMPANDVTITGSFTLIDGIQPLNANTGIKQIYTLDGKPVKTLQKGVNIVHQSDGTVKKVYVP